MTIQRVPNVADEIEAELLDFEAARARRQPGAGDDRDDLDAPLDDATAAPRTDTRELARRFIGARASHPDGITIRRWRGDWYRWQRETGCYRALTEERMDVELYNALPIGKRSDVAEVRLALMAVDRVLIDEVEIGSWLDGACPAGVAPLETVATRSGLVHLPSGRLTPGTPRYFTTTALPLDYDPDAPTPARWLAFLRQLWPDDEASIALLQEWMGYLLVPDTRQHKILFLIGKPRSGKGTIGRVATALLGGSANVAAPRLAQFGQTFGVQPLIGKLAAIVADARLSGRTDVALIVEQLLSISGEDHMTVDRKNRESWNGILPTRLTIISNEIPMLVETSTALADRSLMLKLDRSFLGHEDTDLTGKLLEELPGIFLWAIEGWRRLRARGRFAPTATSSRLAEQMADLASPVGAWVRRRCVTDETDRDRCIKCGDAYADFKAWCTENGIAHVPTLAKFGRDIDTVAGCERVRLSPKFPGSPRPWVYLGLRIRTEEEDTDGVE